VENDANAIKKLNLQKADLESQLEELGAKLGDAESKGGDLSKVKKKLEADISDLNNQLADMTGKFSKSDAESKSKENQIRKLQDEKAAQDENVARLNKEKRRLGEAGAACAEQLQQEEDKVTFFFFIKVIFYFFFFCVTNVFCVSSLFCFCFDSLVVLNHRYHPLLFLLFTFLQTFTPKNFWVLGLGWVYKPKPNTQKCSYPSPIPIPKTQKILYLNTISIPKTQKILYPKPKNFLSETSAFLSKFSQSVLNLYPHSFLLLF
jgi:hypothetical protein